MLELQRHRPTCVPVLLALPTNFGGEKINFQNDSKFSLCGFQKCVPPGRPQGSQPGSELLLLEQPSSKTSGIYGCWEFNGKVSGISEEK